MTAAQLACEVGQKDSCGMVLATMASTRTWSMQHHSSCMQSARQAVHLPRADICPVGVLSPSGR